MRAYFFVRMEEKTLLENSVQNLKKYTQQLPTIIQIFFFYLPYVL